MRRPCFVALVALATNGCVVHHGKTNAPGIAKPREAPEDRKREELIAPDDPGENVVVVSPGPFVGGGTTNRGTGIYRIGAELSMSYGTAPRSHPDDFLVMSQHAGGINVGVVPVEQGTFVSSPAIYGEAQYRYEMSGLAAGWSVRPGIGGGPQVTGFFGPIYLRSTTTLKEGTALTVGLMFKWPMTIVWSR